MAEFSIHRCKEVDGFRAILQKDGSGWISFDIQSNYMWNEHIDKNDICLFTDDLKAFLDKLKTQIKELETESYGG